MSARVTPLSLAALVFAVVAAATPRAAHAQGAPADTSVEGYVRAMADSTDQWFGLSARPADTTGVDSARVWAVAHPDAKPRHKVRQFSLAPLLAFNRALGGAMGGEVAAGAWRGPGRLTASGQWTTGADLWLGEGSYVKRWASSDIDPSGLRLELRGGRRYGAMDRDYYDPVLSSFAAFVYGSDRSDYLRRDGVRGSLALSGAPGWLVVGGRDERESALTTTASWTLFHARPVVEANAAAFETRVHELIVRAGWRPTFAPLTIEGQAWSAMKKLGSDVHYNRWRCVAGGALGLGHHVAFAPEVEYGRLTGAALPQDALYLGGGTLRSLKAQSLQGTGRALAHADFILTDALQTLVGFDHNPRVPMQLGVFVGTGAIWGTDARTGAAALTTRDWPERDAWRSEVGVSLMYRPGLPAPDSFVRVDWAFPVGAGRSGNTMYVSYSRALNFLSR